MAFLHLTNDDLKTMLPCKVGAARKLTVMIEALKSSTGNQSQSQTSEPAANTSIATEGIPSASASSGSIALSDLPVASTSATSIAFSISIQSSDFPLPTYRRRIADVLEKGEVMLDFDMFIEETAYHIIGHGDMTTKDQYERFGRRLLGAYPCLEFPGRKTSWLLNYFLTLTKNCNFYPHDCIYCYKWVSLAVIAFLVMVFYKSLEACLHATSP